jgi:hypothetical protein
MAYSAGDTILDDEYNEFVNSSSDPYGYNHFAGPGSGVYGLNQATISTVSAGGTVQASQWNSLFTGLDNIANHTNVSITASSVSAGDTIAIRAALITDLANLAAAVAGGSTSATAIDAPVAAGSSTNAGTWNATSTIERSITFADNATMRAFFNAGGYVRIDPSCVTGIDGDKDTVFNDLTTTAIGNLDLKAHSTTRSGSGETLTTNGLANGFHDLGTSYTVLLKLTSDNSGYTSNTVEISAKLDAAVSSATVLTIKMVSTDPADDTTYTSPNTSGVPANPNEAPRMTLALLTANPNDTQGLAADITPSSNAEVSNSTTN